MYSEAHLRQSVDAFLKAAESWDVGGYARFFSANAIKIDPYGSQPVMGRDAIVQRYQVKRVEKLKEWKIVPHDVFVSGNGVALRWTVSVWPKTGETAVYEGIDLFEFDEDGLCEKMITFPQIQRKN